MSTARQAIAARRKARADKRYNAQKARKHSFRGHIKTPKKKKG